MNDKQKTELQQTIIKAFDDIADSSKAFKAGKFGAMDVCLVLAINSLQHARNILKEAGKQ